MGSSETSSKKGKSIHPTTELIEYFLKRCKEEGIKVVVGQGKPGTSRVTLNPSRELVRQYHQYQERLKNSKA